VFQHSLIYSLLEIGGRAETRAGLASASAAVQRAALIALEQMEGGDLRAADLLPFLRNGDAELRQAALWIFRRHPEWAGESAGLASEILASRSATPAEREEKEGLLRLLSVAPAVQTRVAQQIASASTEEQLMLFKAVSEAHPKEFSAEWTEVIRSRLGGQETPLVRAAVTAAGELNVNPKKPNPSAAELAPLLLAVAEDATRPAELRMDALLARAGKIELTNAALLELTVTNLEASLPPAMRAKALEALQRASLGSAGLAKVAEALPRVTPIELPRLLAVFDKQSDATLGRRLLAALNQSVAARSLPAGNVKALFDKYPEAVRTEAAAFIQSLNTDADKEAAQLESLLAELKSLKGDTRRGQALFNSPKTLCIACHKIGYLGGNVGPDLTSIGQARSERDLLEAVVFPSASFVRGYEPVIISTRSGEEYSGVLRKDSAEELVVATGPNSDIKIARADVTGMRPGKVSVMPQGLDAQLSKQELADLVAFLKNTKWGPQ
jgi:putative heme-binding domain-containing protein